MDAARPQEWTQGPRTGPHSVACQSQSKVPSRTEVALVGDRQLGDLGPSRSGVGRCSTHIIRSNRQGPGSEEKGRGHGGPTESRYVGTLVRTLVYFLVGWLGPRSSWSAASTHGSRQPHSGLARLLSSVVSIFGQLDSKGAGVPAHSECTLHSVPPLQLRLKRLHPPAAFCRDISSPGPALPAWSQCIVILITPHHGDRPLLPTPGLPPAC